MGQEAGLEDHRRFPCGLDLEFERSGGAIGRISGTDRNFVSTAVFSTHCSRAVFDPNKFHLSWCGGKERHFARMAGDQSRSLSARQPAEAQTRDERG